MESATPLKSMKLSATLGTPVKVVGVLKESAGGKSLSGRNFDFINRKSAPAVYYWLYALCPSLSGPRIPKPLLITHHGDSEIELVCKEILGLTKLNWNTTAFSTEILITLEFARQVGKILSEALDIVLRDHYLFYM